MTNEQEQFQAWGIVDLFGHTRLAGRISEHTIGGETFIRVDVPHDEYGYHTRLFGKGAIYGISLTDERLARETAKRCGSRPVQSYDVSNLIEDARPEIERQAKARLTATLPDDDDAQDVEALF